MGAMRYGLPCHILTTKGFTMISFNTPNRAYLVTSHGNGWAYEITDQQTGHSLWFQDDEALRLQEESQDFELETVLDQYFECIGE